LAILGARRRRRRGRWEAWAAVDETTQFDTYQEHLRTRAWSWDDVAHFYEGHGVPQSIVPLHELDHRDVYQRTYGRPIGANGIGRLREVALTTITDAEDRIYADDLPYAAAPELLDAHGVGPRGLGRLAGIDRCRAEQERYAALLEAEGVTVHWIDWGEDPVAAYGPMHAMWAAGELLVVEGGAIVPKRGRDPFSIGRGEWLSRWAFWNLNIPTLLTVAGTGIAEAGTLVWLAEDVFVAGDSIAYNPDGMAQVLAVVERSIRVPELHVVEIHGQGERSFDAETGQAAHVDDLIAPLDVDTVLCYTPGVDTMALLWLREHGYRIVPADFDDHVRHKVCNLTVLEPGRVVMPAGADETIARVREAGVEVIEVPYGGFHAAGGGLHTATLQIHREQGPSRFGPRADPTEAGT
jgi:N-dimethylarginine dimethylaminohydrolase